MLTIIPVKPFQEAKTRLAPLLSVRERAALSRRLLQRTIKLARQVGQVAVISRDGAVRRLAKQMGAWALVEAGQSLNEALQQASAWAEAHDNQAILILPGDLPLLNYTTLTDMMRLGQRSPAIVIAPCRRQEGTNALLLRPPNLMRFAFGKGSFAEHMCRATAAGVEPVSYISPLLGLDLDLPEDLAQLRQLREMEANCSRPAPEDSACILP
jgi:2-phospho-L-lactate guanylyltransferase